MKFCSYKNYSVDLNKKVLGEVNFSSRENLDSVNVTYSNFTQGHW